MPNRYSSIGPSRRRVSTFGVYGGGLGATVAAGVMLVVISVVIGWQMRSGLGLVPDVVIAVGAGMLMAALGAGIVIGAVALARRLPLVPVSVLLGVLLGLAVVIPLASILAPMTMVLSAFVAVPLLVAAALLGGALGYAFQHGFGRLSSILLLVVGVVAGAAILFWFVNPGQAAIIGPPTTTPGPDTALHDAANPGLLGPYAVGSFTYGSGTDRRRPEYGTAVDITTRSVDGTPLIIGWSGLKGRLRTSYWGFGPDALPLNGRVWYPEGDGPFPLVLIVHGNHRMFDYSDPGYAYLGEHLASRGFIAASVDQNFLNGSLYGELGGENAARAWLLLQHLNEWQRWNESADHPLAGRIDMDRIALIGHSRGGEAVALAHLYNDLPLYPGDAAVTLDFGFNIRSLVAIAPTDGLSEPGDRPAPVDNVNYLLLTGIHDADVVDLSGGRVYERVRPAAGTDQFKAALHVYRANHGQFNTEWGDKDFPLPFHWLLNKQPLLIGEQQRHITAVYVTAFLEATLLDNADYIPMFQDYRNAAHWLPDTFYVSHYRDAGYRTIANFGEDVNLTTTTLPGGTITAHNLTTWHEGMLPTPYNYGTNFGAAVAWEQGDGAYIISLPRGWSENAGVDEQSALVLSLAHGAGPWPLDFTVRLSFADGSETALPLSDFGPLQPVPDVKRFKLGRLEGIITGGNPLLPQQFQLPLAAFVSAEADPPAELRSIEFVFDRSPEGIIYIDEVAVTTGR